MRQGTKCSECGHKHSVLRDYRKFTVTGKMEVTQEIQVCVNVNCDFREVN